VALVSRRSLVVGMAGFAAAPAVAATGPAMPRRPAVRAEWAPAAVPAGAQVPVAWEGDFPLWVRSAHTGEEVRIPPVVGGRYHGGNMIRLNWVLRDFRAGQAVQMDPVMYVLLLHLHRFVKPSVPVTINSGYRSEATNARLVREGAVRNSFHLRGQAVDFTIAGVPVDYLVEAVRWLGVGGCGHYDRFVHADSGHRRFWDGRKPQDVDGKPAD